MAGRPVGDRVELEVLVTSGLGDNSYVLASRGEALVVNVTGERILTPLIGPDKSGPQPFQSILGKLRDDIVTGLRKPTAQLFQLLNSRFDEIQITGFRDALPQQ